MSLDTSSNTQPAEGSTPLVPLEPPKKTPLVPLEKPKTTLQTKIRSLEHLKQVEPKLYQEFMRGIATEICQKIKKESDRFKKKMKEIQAESKRR